MRENVEKLKTIMDLISEQEKQILSLREAFDITVKPSVEALKTLKESFEAEKAIIETIVLDEFKQSGTKKFFGGIGAQERKTIDYDEVKVFEWALDKKLFLTLDKKAFEKVADSIGAPTVVIGKKITTTFPKEIKLED